MEGIIRHAKAVVAKSLDSVDSGDLVHESSFRSFDLCISQVLQENYKTSRVFPDIAKITTDK